MVDRKSHVAFEMNQSGVDEELSQVGELLNELLQKVDDIKK